MRVLLRRLRPPVVDGARRGGVGRLGGDARKVAARRRLQLHRPEADVDQVGGQARLVVGVLVEVRLGRADEREEHRVGAQLGVRFALKVHLGHPQLAARLEDAERLGAHRARRRRRQLVDHQREAHRVGRAVGQPRRRAVGAAVLYSPRERRGVDRVHPRRPPRRERLQPPPDRQKVRREVEADDRARLRVALGEAPRRDAGRAAKVDERRVGRAVRAHRVQRVVERAAEGVLALAAVRRKIARADRAARHLLLPRRLPAQVALVVRVERAAVVLGDVDRLGRGQRRLVHLPVALALDPLLRLGPRHAVRLGRLHHRGARLRHDERLVERRGDERLDHGLADGREAGRRGDAERHDRQHRAARARARRPRLSAAHSLAAAASRRCSSPRASIPERQ